MTKDESFSTWAPDGLPWSAWVKPVLFAHMREEMPATVPARITMELSSIPRPDGKTAVIVDLFDAQSAQAGLALAAYGYRPVPLYNAIPYYAGTVPVLIPFSLRTQQKTPLSVVDLQPIMSSLYHATMALRSLSLGPKAPPAFLIHSNRRKGNRAVMDGRFDNRSMVFTTDFPSADFFRQRGVTKVLLVQDRGTKPARDMYEVLRHFSEAGLEMQILPLSPEGSTASPFVLRKPSWWSDCWFANVTVKALGRDAGGHFGRLVQSSG